MGSFFYAIHFQSLIPYPLSLSENLMYETFIQTNAMEMSPRPTSPSPQSN